MSQLSMDFDLTLDEAKVVALIGRGRANAVQVNVLALLTGIHEREVREIVRHLIEEHGLCIGSSTGRPAGYYIITDPVELEVVAASLLRRGKSILRRYSELRKAAREAVFHQEAL